MSKLSRTKNQRRRLFQGLARDLILRGKIRTTLGKAKAVQPLIEKLVTKAKKGLQREISKVISSRDIEKILLSDAKTRFSKRSSGFTRIVKLGKRLGDATEEVFLQFVDEPEKAVDKKIEPKKNATLVKKLPVKKEKKSVKKSTNKKS